MAPGIEDTPLTPEPALGVSTWNASIEGESQALARAAATAGLDAPVPTCPNWQVRDLLRHLGGVHRWATAHVADARSEPMPKEEQERLMTSYPGDEALLDWFRRGERSLRQALATAPPDLRCWAFLPAPSPLAFWSRRQAHETEIHRADAQLATQAEISPFAPRIAADGIEEMLFGFAARHRRMALPSELRMALLPQDLAEGWLVRLGADGVTAVRGREDADCRVSGTASQLYLLLWNRLPDTALAVEGDRSTLEIWRRSIRVRWD